MSFKYVISFVFVCSVFGIAAGMEVRDSVLTDNERYKKNIEQDIIRYSTASQHTPEFRQKSRLLLAINAAHLGAIDCQKKWNKLKKKIEAVKGLHGDQVLTLQEELQDLKREICGYLSDLFSALIKKAPSALERTTRLLIKKIQKRAFFSIEEMNVFFISLAKVSGDDEFENIKKSVSSLRSVFEELELFGYQSNLFLNITKRIQ